MSKKLVILEDYIDNTKYYIEDLKKNKSITDITIILWVPNEGMEGEILQRHEEWLNKNNIRCETVNMWTIKQKLESLYLDNENIFLFDMDLVGDKSTTFDNRINIIFAKKKKKRCQCITEERIWFYTAIKDASQLTRLRKEFVDRVIDVEYIMANGLKLSWDSNKAAKEFIEILSKE